MTPQQFAEAFASDAANCGDDVKQFAGDFQNAVRDGDVARARSMLNKIDGAVWNLRMHTEHAISKLTETN